MKNLQKHIRKILREDENKLNKILDKIKEYGIDSLTNIEKQYLDNVSKGVSDDEVNDIVDIDTGYEFNDVVNGLDVKFIYNETEEWDEDPVEYKHIGNFFIDDEEYYTTMYTNEKYNVHSFDLHDGDDYVEFDDNLEEKLLKFFKKVGNKIKKSM